MDPTWRHRHGLRPTLRHLSILVVHAALLSAAASSLLRDPAFRKQAWLLTLLAPLSLPLLALLVLLFDRPGPAKAWLAGLLGALFVPAMAAWGVGMAWAAGWPPQTPRAWLALPAVTVAAVLLFARAVRPRLPGRCPDCGLRAVLPISRIRWCAGCGRKAPDPPREGADRRPADRSSRGPS
jgi:hypothetical protein